MLIIMQGISGSGKTTTAKKLAKEHDALIFSTDDYFIGEDGVYCWDAAKLREYHQKNYERTVDALNQCKNVIVDNTNIQCWEPRPYVQAAVERGIEVRFVRTTGNYQNLHGVPQEHVERMRARMENLDVESVLASRPPWER